MNRQITGRIASLHFAPTELSRDNLLHENIAESAIEVTGNTVIDSLHQVVKRIDQDAELRANLEKELRHFGYDVSLLHSGRKLVLITGHRRENFGTSFINICEALRELSMENEMVDFVYPMHLNPNVRQPIRDVFGVNPPDNMFFIEPLNYLPFIFLMEKSHLVLTDSGGIQEEAPGLGKPVLVMRNTTERPEAVASGTVRLVGTDKNSIKNAVERLLMDSSYYEMMHKAVNPYGDGHACRRIIERLKRFFILENK